MMSAHNIKKNSYMQQTTEKVINHKLKITNPYLSHLHSLQVLQYILDSEIVKHIHGQAGADNRAFVVVADL